MGHCTVVSALLVLAFISGSHQQRTRFPHDDDVRGAGEGFPTQQWEVSTLPPVPQPRIPVQSNETDTGAALDPRLLGGSIVPKEEVPYVVSIHDQNVFKCTGIIVSERYVLTSRSCDLREAKNIRIAAGNERATMQPPSVVKAVEKVINYDRGQNPLNSDPTLLKVDSNFNLGPRVWAIKLNEFEVPTNTQCNLTSWRVVYLNQMVSEVVSMTVSDVNLCSNRVQTRLSDAHMCAVRTYGSGICPPYNLGGALVCNGRLTGVASPDCGAYPGSPSIYARIMHYRPWIQQQINASSTLGVSRSMLILQLLASALLCVYRSYL